MKRSMILLGAVFVLMTATVQAEDRPALGITMDDNASKAHAGVAVATIVAGSPAAQAGLLAGDRITAIDQQPVSNSADVIKMIAGSGVNRQVTVDVTRGAWQASLTATLRKKDDVFRAPPPAPTTSYYYQQCPSCQYQYQSTDGYYRVGNIIINGRRWGDIGYRYSYGDLLRW